MIGSSLSYIFLYGIFTIVILFIRFVSHEPRVNGYFMFIIIRTFFFDIADYGCALL